MGFLCKTSRCGEFRTTLQQRKCHRVRRLLLQSSIPFSSLANQDFKKVLNRAPVTPISAQDGRTYRHSAEKT
jgi:hypothetical protein